jgi:hypothetical protein
MALPPKKPTTLNTEKRGPSHFFFTHLVCTAEVREELNVSVARRTTPNANCQKGKKTWRHFPNYDEVFRAPTPTPRIRNRLRSSNNVPTEIAGRKHVGQKEKRTITDHVYKAIGRSVTNYYATRLFGRHS